MTTRLHVLKNPLTAHWISHIREKQSTCKEFRQGIELLSHALILEAGVTLTEAVYSLESPVGVGAGSRISEKIALVPILRAGLGMVAPILDWAPNASVYHFGLARDHNTLQPGIYYDNVPSSLEGKVCLILDPMIATGGSALAAIERVQESKPLRVSLLGIIGARQGVENIHSCFPKVDIFLAALDEKLNAKGYITPGLGDAGDRCFNS